MFHDRSDAGQRLAKKLTAYADRKDTIVLGLPRGGVPVAFEIAQELHLPLDVLLVRKLGVPGQTELAMGAIAMGGIKILDHALIGQLGIADQEVASTIAQEEEELRRREQAYRDQQFNRTFANLQVIVVDDGIATGSSMLAAIQVLRSQQAAKIIVAVPVAPPHAESEIKAVAQEFICLQVSEYFPAVGSFYHDFSQVEDEEVRILLARSAQTMALRDAERPS
jgi:putative phosphoribosyl transferase